MVRALARWPHTPDGCACMYRSLRPRRRTSCAAAKVRGSYFPPPPPGISPYLPTSRAAASAPCPSPYLPTSPRISPYLPISPRRCGQQPVLPAPRRRLFLGARAGVLCRWQEGALASNNESMNQSSAVLMARAPSLNSLLTHKQSVSVLTLPVARRRPRFKELVHQTMSQ